MPLTISDRKKARSCTRVATPYTSYTSGGKPIGKRSVGKNKVLAIHLTNMCRLR